MNPSNIRLSLTETLWLESEYFDHARASSSNLADEPQQWKSYLNSLGASAFAAWAKEKLPSVTVWVIADETVTDSYLEIGGFKICLITTEHVLDEIVRFSSEIVEQSELVAHFYVVLEILEDQHQAFIRGALRYDELVQQLKYVSQLSSQYLLPLSFWDAEINHLLAYVQYTHPSAISLPTATAQSLQPSRIEDSLTRLGQWLDESFIEGWQSIDRLINPTANLAWSARKGTSGVKRGKLINLGTQFEQQTVALIVTVMPESARIGVNIQIFPTGEDSVLPRQLTVTLRSSTGKVLQAVTSRAQDNYIQLRPFRGEPGIHFAVEVMLNGVKTSEAFEL
jgi:hypothetical protein